jgi:hypothetical protein
MDQLQLLACHRHRRQKPVAKHSETCGKCGWQQPAVGTFFLEEDLSQPGERRLVGVPKMDIERRAKGR